MKIFWLMVPWCTVCCQNGLAVTNDSFAPASLTPRDVLVSNVVRFVVDHVGGEPPHDAVEFSVTVHNLGTNGIPNLNPVNVVKYMQRLLDGKPVSTGAEFGGMYKGGKPLLEKGDSDTYGWGEYLKVPNRWPDVFTIQWKYLGVPSNILKVNLLEKTVEDVTEKTLPNKAPEATR